MRVVVVVKRIVMTAALLPAVACTPAPKPVDLLQAGGPGEDKTAVLEHLGRPLRMRDVVRRALPAGPPSRYLFSVDVPKGARLTFACGIAPEYQDRPGVEFMLKVRRNGRTETVFTKLLDPLSHPEHRSWVPGAVDLGKYAGRGVELILETHGYEETGPSVRAAWGTPGITVPKDDAPLVILYLVDTLRADHTGPYGYPRDTTRHLNAFAKDAIVFDQAVAHASWTKPSVASILTSLLPGQHRAVQLRDPLDPSHATIAEMLKAGGYATGAAIANSVIYGAESSFDRMFEPHPAPGHPAQDPRTDSLEPADRERLMAQYDGDIAFGDQEFGRFLKVLKDRGLYEHALIVFLADHGEEFLDHGQWLHGRSVFDELIRIPLVVKFPGRRGAGERVTQQVQAVDIVPTVLENERVPIPSGLAGHPLQRVLEGKAGRTPAISEISHRGIVAQGVRTEGDKYIRRFGPEQDELYYDLAKDPKEQTSLLDARPERVRFLKAQAESAMSPNPFRYVLRVAGTGEYALSLASGGWIEGVEATGLGPDERFTVRENGRRLELDARPRPGKPREISFTLRPRGAPVVLQGTRDGRPLRPADVSLAESAAHPASFPFRLPDIESEAEHEQTLNLFASPRGDPAGVAVWLALPPGRKLMEFDKETRERLKALGYLGPN